MDAVLSTLAKRFADTWLTMLVLPGLLYAAALMVGHAAGHRHALDGARVRASLESLGQSVQKSGSAGTVLLLAGVVAISAVAVYAARSLGAAVQWLWLGGWGGADSWLVQRRRTRWDALQQRYATQLLALDAGTHSPEDQERRTLGELAAARNRIALARPLRPTWIGDRFAGVEARVWAEYHVDLSFGWTRLWLVLPEETRAECATTRAAFDAAGGLAGWGVLYLVLGCWWWPAAVIAPVLIVLAWRRGRQTAAAFSELIESVVDVHGGDLAARLAVADGQQPLDSTVGARITARTRKDA
ncbi:hypothetical protein [Streptomyces sp. NPDC059224]|uniref:hypothetical protein n=1 Tax=Streptomyces sp. NPDC059224 TaxID=3346775 RepID=UPI0036D05B1F